MDASLISRREMLAGLTAATLVSELPAADPATTVRIGLIADPHHGLAPDALSRLDAFMDSMNRAKPDALIQLGDFCHPPRAVPEAKDFLKIWNQFRGPKYHVIGNHDLDNAREKQEVLDCWQLKQPYYSFDIGPVHIAVLDCNFVLEDKKYLDWKPGQRYQNHVHPEQAEWLESDLIITKKPTIILSHQALDEVWYGGRVPNRLVIRNVIDRVHRREKRQKVLACLCGHHHLDHYSTIDRVPYLHINSASYFWVGEEYGRMAAYRDPLFALMTIDLFDGTLRILGRESVFNAPSPSDRDYPDAARISASIRNRLIRFDPWR